MYSNETLSVVSHNINLLALIFQDRQYWQICPQTTQPCVAGFESVVLNEGKQPNLFLDGTQYISE